MYFHQISSKSPKLEATPFIKGSDRIGCLPDEILAGILSFLPLNETVATSLLSRRWRSVYCWITNLDLKRPFGLKYTDHGGMLFEQFVSAFFARLKSSNIEKFSLRNIHAGSLVIANCIENVAIRNVKEFRLTVNGSLPLAISHCLFQCRTLVSLRLVHYNGYYTVDLTEMAFLPCLKIMHLERVEFTENSFSNLFNGCPSLTELYASDCDAVGEGVCNVSAPALRRLNVERSSRICRFDAPSLHYLKFKGIMPFDYCMANLDSIHESELRVHQTSVYPLLRAITSMHNVHILHLFIASWLDYGGDWKSVSSDFESNKLSLPVLPNLLRLEVDPYTAFFRTDAGWRVLREIVIQSPKLEEIAFTDGWYQPFNRQSDHLHSHHKAIEVNKFYDEDLEYIRVLEWKVLRLIVLRKVDLAWKKCPSIKDILASLVKAFNDH